MTIDEAKKMLEAKLKCLIAETSGTNYDCNQHLCEGCSLNYEQGNMGEQKQALEMAIKALEQQPSEDAISREALTQKLNAWDSKAHGIPNYAWKVIRELPSVTPERPKGKWIHWTDDYKDYCTCSECGYGEEGEVLLKDKTPYCPYCGSYNGGNDNGDE